MNEIYCAIGKSKKALLLVDNKLVDMTIQFSEENKTVYLSFNNIDKDEYCNCVLGKMAWEQQLRTLAKKGWEQSNIIPHKFCGYCSKKYPPVNDYVVQLINYEEIDDTRNNKTDRKEFEEDKKNTI